MRIVANHCNWTWLLTAFHRQSSHVDKCMCQWVTMQTFTSLCSDCRQTHQQRPTGLVNNSQQWESDMLLVCLHSFQEQDGQPSRTMNSNAKCVDVLLTCFWVNPLFLSVSWITLVDTLIFWHSCSSDCNSVKSRSGVLLMKLSRYWYFC